jgi:hypothetical protein
VRGRAVHLRRRPAIRGDANTAACAGSGTGTSAGTSTGTSGKGAAARACSIVRKPFQSQLRLPAGGLEAHAPPPGSAGDRARGKRGGVRP